MALFQVQSNLNRGEIDPIAIGRIDLDAYFNGVRTADNVLPIPQGGMKKRPGMAFLGTALGDGRTENFSFNIEQNYLLVFTALKMQIYKDGVLQTNINGSGDDFAVTPWSLAQLADIDYIQSADTAIVVHPDVQFHTITRTSDTDWDVSVLTITNTPQFDYNDGSSPTPVSQVQRLSFTSFTAGDRFKLSLDGILSEEIAFGGGTGKNIEVGLLDLPNTANTGVSVVFISAGEFDITFSDDSADDYDDISGAIIFAQSSAARLSGNVTTAGTSRAEDVWSAGRGWPRTATFHEGRLFFGGSKSRPATIWGSKVNDFFNFDEGRGLDDTLVSATLDTDQVNAVEGIFSNRALQIFTSGGEFFVPESPITPSNIAVNPQTNLGSRRVRPVTIDGVTLFVQRTGKSVNQFVFINEFQANQTRSVSTLASHLINTPIKLSVSRGTSKTDANYVYILNNDGSLTVFNTLISEGVQGFTSWSTNGLIKSIAVVDDRLYFLVERVINSVTVQFIEREDDLLNADAGVRSSVSTSPILTGLDHLDGETVRVKADEAVQDDEVVASGQITIGRDAEIIEAGLNYVPTIRTMPLNVGLKNGPNVFAKKKIQRVALQLFESNGIIVNGQIIADKTIGQDQFDSPTPQTGEVRIHVLGWTLDASVTITQVDPVPMTILSIGLEIAL